MTVAMKRLVQTELEVVRYADPVKFVVSFPLHRIEALGLMWGTKALAGEKIQAIKDCRTTFGCGLKEAKYFVEQYVDDLRQTYPKYAAHLIDLSNASRENR